jgi:hypothetical protein
VSETSDQNNLEGAVGHLKASTARYAASDAELSREALADMTNAIHEIGDHLVDLHRRISRIEESQDEWTTRGWLPPPGSDSPG